MRNDAFSQAYVVVSVKCAYIRRTKYRAKNEYRYLCEPMWSFSVFLTQPAVRATGLAFAGSGMLFGAWAASIPWLKSKFSLDEAQLGLLLLAPPAGIVAANLLAVPLLARMGAARSTTLMLMAAAWALVIPMALPKVWQTATALVCLGGCLAILNVAMNTCATLLEEHTHQRIMAACHGLWSAGAMTGSALAGIAFGLKMTPLVYACLLATSICTMALATYGALGKVPDYRTQSAATQKAAGGKVTIPASLWMLILLSLCTNLTEGSMSDWAAVYMRRHLGAGDTLSALGFSVYACFMAAGRFLGDSLIARMGAGQALRAGGISALLGMCIVILATNPHIALPGFALIGAGVSIGAPILYGAAARTQGMAQGAGLAVMNTFAMLAFLAGPALIGFIAKATNFQLAFGLVALMIGVWIARANRV